MKNVKKMTLTKHMKLGGLLIQGQKRQRLPNILR